MKKYVRTKDGRLFATLGNHPETRYYRSVIDKDVYCFGYGILEEENIALQSDDIEEVLDKATIEQRVFGKEYWNWIYIIDKCSRRVPLESWVRNAKKGMKYRIYGSIFVRDSNDAPILKQVAKFNIEKGEWELL